MLRFKDPKSSVTFRVAKDELACSMLIRAGLDLSHLDQNTLDNASFKYGAAGLDLRGVLNACAEMDGISIAGLDSYAAVEAAASGGTLASIFDGVAETALAVPFAESRDTTRGWVSLREVDNFKQQRRPHMEAQPSMPKLARGDAPESASLSATDAETYKVVRYATKFEVDEQDLVDQDVEAIVRPASAIGRAVMAKKLDLIFAIVLANSALADGVPLFHADHNNLAAISPLSAANLETAQSNMLTQKENGELLGVFPRHLIVPPQMFRVGRELAYQIRLGDGYDLQVRTDPRLSEGVTDPVSGITYAGSDTNWYMATSASLHPVIEFGYIDSPEPRFRTYGLGVGRWGRGYSVVYDVGAKALAYQGLHKATA